MASEKYNARKAILNALLGGRHLSQMDCREFKVEDMNMTSRQSGSPLRSEGQGSRNIGWNQDHSPMAIRILFAIIFVILLVFAIIGMAATCLIVFAILDDQERERIRENNNQSSE